MSDESRESPERIGTYRLVRRLGRGGMGEVWLARDTALKREVAIKLLPEDVSSNERAVKRFLREARSAAKLNHPNVMTIHQIGRHRGRIFVVMELVDGGSLADELRRSGALGWREATQAVREAAAGLAAAHEVGLVHRDVKPSNLMRTGKGQVKVVDFGLARARKETIEVTRPGGVVGTPAFISPEQGRGQKVDARSDLYSLACTYYALLTGRAPFEGDSSSAVIYQHVHEPFPDARLTVADLPEAVCRVLDRGTRKSPIDRYQTAEELMADLDAVLAGAEEYVGGVSTWGVPKESGTEMGWPGRLRSPADAGGEARADRARRNRLITGSILGLAVLAGVVVVLTILLRPRSKPAPAPDWFFSPQEAKRRQREAALVLDADPQTDLDLGGGMTMKLALIPRGFFGMGSAKTEAGWHKDQGPVHQVVISQPFYLGLTEVTQAQWKAVMGTEPWKGKPNVQESEEYPAAVVSWDDCVAFCRAASAKTGRTIRLPTEAEWEWACRAGSGGAYSFGDSAAGLAEHAWYEANTEAKGKAHAMRVGLKKPNAWGLHDVHGNVWEWCSDFYGQEYYARSPKSDPPGPANGEYRVLRGGSWHDPPGGCRSAFRLATSPRLPNANAGFRVVCAVDRK